ncbi:MAG: glycosyltransferase family 2 protein [Bacteroidales bacterium]|nr:glycosyltransferase family 2 protein [Bacteroidales bacterium]
MNNSLVSIITPTYNCGPFIAETIRSVQAQTYTDWEMIIVDDCSTDETRDVVAGFIVNDPRIRYLCNERNSGAAITRNRALREARGRWIAFLDSDDLWEPQKLERQVDFMSANGYAFTYHEYVEMMQDGALRGIRVSGPKRVSRWAMFACCWPGCLSVMYDSTCIGLVQIADIRKNNDTALWLKVVRKSPCYLLPENLARYRRRSGSITPPSIVGRIKALYPLFRVAEGMNPVAAWAWTLVNVAASFYKKIFYVKKYNAV